MFPSAKNCCCFFYFLSHSFPSPPVPPKTRNHLNTTEHTPCNRSKQMKESPRPMWAKRWRTSSCQVSVRSRKVQFVDSKVWRYHTTIWSHWSRYCKRGWRRLRRRRRTSDGIPMRPACCRMARRKGRRRFKLQVLKITFSRVQFWVSPCSLSDAFSYDFAELPLQFYSFDRTQKLISNLYRVFFQEKGHP